MRPRYSTQPCHSGNGIKIIPKERNGIVERNKKHQLEEGKINIALHSKECIKLRKGVALSLGFNISLKLISIEARVDCELVGKWYKRRKKQKQRTIKLYGATLFLIS